nr:F-actin-monooxygenase MICAL3-like [Cherax quadricarinatus]
MYSSHHHHNKPGAPSPDSAAAADIFEQLCAASTFKSVLYHYRQLCDVLRLKPTNIRSFYPKLKSKLRSWKAQALWSKFDKRASHKCYNHGKACSNSKVLIIGAGPCGLRSAIECQLLGAKVVVVEKRDRLSRNNVLHLWPFVISDLKQLGAKKFYGKFCAGAIDHISIRQLQCILLKVALLLGVEVFESVTFEELVEPPADQEEKIGWRARLSPPDHPANQYEFDVLFGADGKRNTLHGFKRKEFRGKLAIAITANFINKRTEAEARVQEISGVAFIFNQKFFKELYAATGIDLENIVYYKDETHYFVMTAKKHSLIDKGVIINDLADTQQLLHSSNVNRSALLDYAREAADFSTNYQLPHLDFAVNHYGKPDVAMFDFTSMFAAENASRMVERKGHKLLAGLVGDTLLEPFWPTGSGCARGFLSCFDAAWMVRSLCSGKMTPLEVLAERESIYRLLAQTTPENLSKDHLSYTLDPASRYPTINVRAVLPFQVRTLFDTDDPSHLEEVTNPHLVNSDDLPKKRKRRDSFIHPDTLLVWCKKQVALYDSIHVDNMTTSFKDGRALCAIIHRYRPDLIDFEALRPEDVAQNNQLAYDILERDFGIPPVMTGAEMAECEVPDKLSMISYLSQIYDVFRGEIPHFKYPKMDDGEMEVEQQYSPTQRSTPHVNILKNLTNKTASTSQGTPSSRKRMSLDRGIGKRDDGRITCRLIDDAGVSTADRRLESLKRTKKRKSEKVSSPQDDIESRQRREEILTNRLDQLRKQKERRELDNVRFIRSMQMLQCGIADPSSVQRSYNRDEDWGITEYRKHCVKTMREKAEDLERKLNHRPVRVENVAAFHTSPADVCDQTLKKKIHENKFGIDVQGEKEKVPKWNRDAYDDKFHNIERRLRENGEDEETIAKYRDIDTSLKRLEMKLREGSTLETGMRGQNKVSNLASQLSSKLEKKEPEVLIMRQVRGSLTFTFWETRVREKPVLCLDEKNILYNLGSNSRMILNSASEPHYHSDDSAKASWVRDNRLSKSFKITGSTALRKEANCLSSNCHMHYGKCRHNSQLFVKLPSGAHLSESDCRSVRTFARDSKCTIMNEKLVQPKRQQKDNVLTNAVLSSVGKTASSCQSLKKLDCSSLETSVIDKVLSSKSNMSYTLMTPSLLSSPSSSSSPLDVTTHQKHVYERPYYDCGYDTDSDSTPPHSSPECASAKLKTPSASSVWRRYLMWLQRMTKTQVVFFRLAASISEELMYIVVGKSYQVMVAHKLLQVPVVVGAGDTTGALVSSLGVGKGVTTGLSPEDRGTTPERVEFENSVVEQSDEDEYLSEDEWTDRNFGASANELDDSDGEDDSDYSDLSDEEVDDEEMRYLDGGGTLTAAETRRLAESWQRRYSTDRLDDEDEGGSAHESESDLDSDNYSEEYGAEGDESHTATEGEGGEDDDEEDEGEAVRRARELRRMEVNIDVAAPPRKAETSDSGSDTEVASDEESEESDTQIDTDSEFAEDHVQPGPPKEIPTIVINESQDTHDTHLGPSVDKGKESKGHGEVGVIHGKGEPRTDFVSQKVDLEQADSKASSDWVKENGEKSASLTNLNETSTINPRAEQLKRLLQRTDSTEAIAAQRALQLKRQYLLGETVNLPRKSVSTADLGSRFKSFMDKISETQKMLNPAPQPSAAMQAFMSSSLPSPRSPASSPSSPLLPARSAYLPQGDNTSESTNTDKVDVDTSLKSSVAVDISASKVTLETAAHEAKQNITTHIESSVYPVEAADEVEVQLKVPDQLKGFPVSEESSKPDEEAISKPEDKLVKVTESESSSETSTSTSSDSGSDYDNVPSGCKWSVSKKSPTAIEIQKEANSCVNDNVVYSSDVKSSDDIINTTASVESYVVQSDISVGKVHVKNERSNVDEQHDSIVSDETIDDFGLSLPGESEGLETVNQELVMANMPHIVDSENIECQNMFNERVQPVSFLNDECTEIENHIDIEDNVDELFNILASEAIEDIDKFSELVESSGTNTNGFSHSDKNSQTSDTLTIQELSVCDKENDQSVSEQVEPIIEIIVENLKTHENLENIQDSLPLKKIMEVSDQTNPVLSKENVSSPEEGRENTEPELSDWAGDNDGLSAGEELEVELDETEKRLVKKDVSKTIARIASEESLGDTDSAVSSCLNITSVPSKPSVLADLEGIEYMDTSESASSPDDISHKQQGYRKLEEETPTTPIAPQISLIDLESASVQDQSGSESKSSESTSTELDDTSQGSVQEAQNNNMAENESKELKDVVNKTKPHISHVMKSMSESHVPKSVSEPPSLSETRPKLNGEHRRDSLDDYTSPKRYEGYIPRFKERMSPFGYVRDSIDIQKNSTKSPLFTPSKKDIEERERNEQRLVQLTVQNTSLESKPFVSPNTAKKQIERSLRNKDKEKEKDLIKELVMSRISRKNSEKSPRRGSRTSVSPLSSTGSRTSLFSPQSSQENLLDKMEHTMQENYIKVENLDKKPVHINSKELLRLDSINAELSESGQTFATEENLAKVKVGSSFRNDSILGMTDKGQSLQEVNVPFVDESQDEDVFERHVKNSSKTAPKQSPSDETINEKHVSDAEPSSPAHINLPATPMTHPEQFIKSPSMRELFKVPAVPVPVTPMRRNKTGASNMSTPISTERPLSTPNLSTVERERVREEARIRARLKTDLDLGLSPPNLVDNLREKLKRGCLSESEGDKEERVREVQALDKLAPVKIQEREDLTPKNKDERVKELLAEQRQHRNKDTTDAQQEGWNKDDRVRERLEEYRQRRRGSTRSSESGDSRPNSQLLRRHTHRPSLLELESLQVFTVPPSKPSVSVPTSIVNATVTESTSSSPTFNSSLYNQQSTLALPAPLVPPPPSLSPATPAIAAISSTTPTSQPLQESTSSEKILEKKSGKKSKDRERRRSLIQVFTGMFSKSGGEDKKKTDQQSPPSNAPDGSSLSKPSLSLVVPASSLMIDTPKCAPKSPSTVRDKLSKLRLSRSKEKKKVEKSRSNSADILGHGSTSETRAAFSLPTSPCRRPIPFLPSSFTKASSPPQASGSTYSSSQVRLTTPRIEEESLSDDEGGSTAGTPVGTLERGLQGTWSGSTNRKHRTAALKAARQAELKRLRMAQEIQRQLEECEVKTRELEERGVAVEKALRGESSGANRDEADLMGDWFSMVHEKNALVRWEQELLVRAKELELEDRHVRLEHELRHRMALSEEEKSREDIDREGTILAEMLSILEQKDALVTMLEEDRQRYMEEDRDLESVMLRKGLQLSPLRRETGV